jgi:two-component system sensor histidine kinase KdpD
MIKWLPLGARVLFVLSMGASALLSHRGRETSVVVVPYREMAAPPPLTQDAPPPQVAIAQLDPGRFKLSVDRDVPLLHADAVQIERALFNVLENAARHSADTVSVRARAVGDRLVLRVVDRGPGIPEAELEHVFAPFYRGHRDAGAGRGSGLGLAIAKGFVEANGGRVWAESLPGQGTVIAFEFPLEPEPHGSATTPPTAAAAR